MESRTTLARMRLLWLYSLWLHFVAVSAFTTPTVGVVPLLPAGFADKNLPVTCLSAKRERPSQPRTRPSRSSRSTRSSSSSRSSTTTTTRRAPHQFDHTTEAPRPFVQNTTAALQEQDSNWDAPVYSLDKTNDNKSRQRIIEHDHVQYYSLDDLFPNLEFSDLFDSVAHFRTDLRGAIRTDVLDTTPAYHNLGETARTILLLPDSSLQGSWKCHQGGWNRRSDNTDHPSSTTTTTATTLRPPRMTETTRILQHYLGSDERVPSGDTFMDTIGRLCGAQPTTHWIDIVGIKNRRIPHSWHQDTGSSSESNRKTVLFGFPAQNHYRGVGVFSHLVKLEREKWADEEHAIHEPVLFDCDIPNEYIVRPLYEKGRELIVYRDVDVLHSSPDIAHRASVMRFM